MDFDFPERRHGAQFFDIISFGPLTLDTIGLTHQLNDSSSAMMLTHLITCYGGRGANFCVFASVLDSQTLLIAPAGRDYLEIGYKRHLEEHAVDTSGVFISEVAPTPRAFIFSDLDDSRTFFYDTINEIELKSFETWTQSLLLNCPHKVLYCTSGIQKLNLMCLYLSKAEIKAFSPGHEILYHSLESLHEALLLANILFLNEHESKILEGRTGRSLHNIADDFNISTLVVTHGKQGSHLIVDKSDIHIPACHPKIEVDGTGAGDAFAAAFLSVLLKTNDPISSAQFASATASFAVEELGCQSSLPTKNDIRERVYNLYSNISNS